MTQPTRGAHTTLALHSSPMVASSPTRHGCGVATPDPVQVSLGRAANHPPWPRDDPEQLAAACEMYPTYVSDIGCGARNPAARPSSAIPTERSQRPTGSSSPGGRDTRFGERWTACDETGRAAPIPLMRRGATAPAAGPNRVRATAVPPEASATRTGPPGTSVISGGAPLARARRRRRPSPRPSIA